MDPATDEVEGGLRVCVAPGFGRRYVLPALRGRTQVGTGSFWTWREQMYAAASRLHPESYQRLARATFAEMAMAGVTCVGEFHYLHHDAGGRPYADPNAMGAALVSAAAEAGIRWLYNSEPVETVDEVDGCRILGRYAIHRGHSAADAAA